MNHYTTYALEAAAQAALDLAAAYNKRTLLDDGVDQLISAALTDAFEAFAQGLTAASTGQKRTVTCACCGGTGNVKICSGKPRTETCNYCAGSGHVTVHGAGSVGTYPCPKCSTPRDTTRYCNCCSGSGQVTLRNHRGEPVGAERCSMCWGSGKL